jgi:hypothetical protein
MEYAAFPLTLVDDCVRPVHGPPDCERDVGKTVSSSHLEKDPEIRALALYLRDDCHSVTAHRDAHTNGYEVNPTRVL